MTSYRVVRFYRDAGIRRRVIETGLTLEQAQAHCNDPETSSSTATGKVGRERTRTVGDWFDGYEQEGGAMTGIARHDCRRTDDDGRALAPLMVTCGNCDRSWCERCDPCPSALCHYCHGMGTTSAPIPPRQARELAR